MTEYRFSNNEVAKKVARSIRRSGQAVTVRRDANDVTVVADDPHQLLRDAFMRLGKAHEYMIVG